MKDRLIELLNDMQDKGYVQAKDEDGVSCHVSNEKLADTILADGWMRPPCKVGDTVYCINKNEIIECIVREFSITSKGLDSLIISQKHKYTRCTFAHSKNLGNLDKIKFTKEEAEKALGGVEG